ncbi:MAG: helix-turn-helix domain-containing protein [Ruminococcaceae bacterium]|nr:helix-turn-helix domain-containing protein [Oscillospiraceae bacterium]
MPVIQKDNFSTDNQMKATFKNKKYRVAVHIHQFAEIIYVLDGEIEIRQKGKLEIAKAGDIAVIYPYQPHGIYTEENKRANIWMLLFSDTLITDIIHSGNAYLGYENTVFTPSEELKTFIESRMIDTGEVLTDLDSTQALNLKALLYPVFSEYLAKKQTPIQLNEALKNKAIAYDTVIRTIIYLRTNFCRDVLISDCSTAIGYSSSYISHCMSKHLGMTFLEFRDNLRINYAKNLLKNDTMSVFMVGAECGFKCDRSFERVFKKITGLTPKQYRTQKLNITVK